MQNTQFEFSTPQVKEAFDAFEEPARSRLLGLRARIFEVAQHNSKIGSVSESLKWGQPSYLSRVGTPIRLGVPKSGGIAIFTHCQTSVIREFRQVFGDTFAYDASRAVLLGADSNLDMGKLDMLFSRALTYRL